MAWPKVWPKLSMALSPCSLSSADTTEAFILQERSTASIISSDRVKTGPALSSRKVEIFAVAYYSVLYYLGESALEFALLKGREHVRVYKDEPRLVEGADKVLPLRMVYGGLAPMELSTWESSVVGTCMYGTPLR